MNKLYVLIPCYNEAENIGDLIEGWIEQRIELEKRGYVLKVHAIDDCSKDNTKGIILSKAEKYPESVSLIAHEVNKNLCGGLNTAVSFFNEKGDSGDLMCIMDGDNTQSPKYITQMVDKLIDENKDCVIASRYRKGAEVVGLAGYRKFMSDMARVYYTMVLHIPGVRDYTCGYRVYKYDVIKGVVDKFGNDPIKEKTFACMMELLYKSYMTGAKFGEVGFELRYDQKIGQSKMNVRKTMMKSLSVAWKLKIHKGRI